MTTLLSADRVTCRFGALTAVDDVSFVVSSGEVVGLLGANGAGKTTVIRMLLGLLRPTAGTVGLLGGPPDRRRRGRLGYVPQGLGLYQDLTVEENLRFLSGAYGVAPPQPPDELADRGRDLVADLPLGSQRHLAFRAALAHPVDVLVLDEPTSGVDPLARASLWDTVRAQAQRGVGVLVTTHYLQEAEQCDRLLLMAAGRLVAQGTVAEVVGDAHCVAVHTGSWAAAFAALDAAGLPVTLAGRAVRVADGDPDRVSESLSGAGVDATVEVVPATLEERMTLLTRAAAAGAG